MFFILATGTGDKCHQTKTSGTLIYTVMEIVIDYRTSLARYLCQIKNLTYRCLNTKTLTTNMTYKMFDYDN